MYGNKMKQLKQAALSSARGQLSGKVDKAMEQIKSGPRREIMAQQSTRLPVPPSRVQKSPTVSSAPKPNARGPLPVSSAPKPNARGPLPMGEVRRISASYTDKKKRLA